MQGLSTDIAYIELEGAKTKVVGPSRIGANSKHTNPLEKVQRYSCKCMKFLSFFFLPDLLMGISVLLLLYFDNCFRIQTIIFSL